MKLVALERTFSPELSVSISLDDWMQVNHTLDGCLEARQVQWLYSLVSVNGDRAICLCHTPYTETVREACRQSRTPFQKAWAADLWVAQAPQSFSQGAALIVVETHYDQPITKTMVEEIKAQAQGCLHELNIQSAFSILAADGSRSACTFSASSAEQVRLLYRKVGLPFERVWKAALIQPMVQSVSAIHSTL